MKSAGFLMIAISAVSACSFAQNPDCRQSWMPTDAPAFCAFDAEPPLPEARTYHAVATSGNNIYVLGGFRFDAASGNVIYYNSVVRSTIGTNGRLSTWTAETAFTNARSGAGAVRAGNCMFLAGGSSSTPTSLTYYDDTQSAKVDGSGRLSAWTTSPNKLKTPRSNHTLVAVQTAQGIFLNAVAGVTQIGADTVHLDTIEVAKVGNDCTIGPWTLANFHLKGGRSSPQAVTIRNNVVVIGGWGDLDLIDVNDDVQVSPARADGTPSPWRTSPGPLATGIYGHATVLANIEAQPISLLFAVGGQPGTGVYANWISYAYVLPALPVADSIGIWRIAPTGKLPTGRAGLGAAESKARLYVIGGNDAAGKYYNEVLSTRFDAGRP
jgi:hypothetical protein